MGAALHLGGIHLQRQSEDFTSRGLGEPSQSEWSLKCGFVEDGAFLKIIVTLSYTALDGERRSALGLELARARGSYGSES